MPALPDSLGVLRRRDVRLLLVGRGVSSFGDRMVTVALAFAVLGLGGSASAVGLVLAAAMVPMVASVLVGGVVADRESRRAVMVAADLVRVVSQGAMAALLIVGAAHIWMLALLAGVTGAATGFFNPAAIGLLPELVPPDELQPANALRSTTVAASEILGPLAAGGLVVAAGAGWAIGADAATFAVSAACLLRLRTAGPPERRHASFAADLRDGWAAVRARRWVCAFLAYFAFGNMLWAAWSGLGPVVAERRLGGAGAWGVVLGALGAGALLGSIAATRARPVRPLIHVALMEGLFVLPLACLASGAGVPVLACGALLSGVGMMLGMSVWESTLQRHVPGESLSRVSSYDWFASFAFYPLGLALWGPLAGAIGVGPALWLAFGLLAAAIAGLFAVPDLWRLRDEAPARR